MPQKTRAVALAAALSITGSLAVTAAADAKLRMPFKCGVQVNGEVRANHDPPNAIDFNGLGYGTTTQTQEQRTAIMGSDDAQTYDVSGPIHWGDSGGPLVHKRTGKALGIVSRLCAGACSEEGPTVQGILAKAAAAGFPVTLRTV